MSNVQYGFRPIRPYRHHALIEAPFVFITPIPVLRSPPHPISPAPKQAGSPMRRVAGSFGDEDDFDYYAPPEPARLLNTAAAAAVAAAVGAPAGGEAVGEGHCGGWGPGWEWGCYPLSAVQNPAADSLPFQTQAVAADPLQPFHPMPISQSSPPPPQLEEGGNFKVCLE